MKYTLKAPPSKTEQSLAFDIPDNPATITPVITGTTPIDPVPPGNQPPTADAGSDVSITLPVSSVTLIGRGADPEGNAVNFNWTKKSGPSAGNIMSPSSANTDVVSLAQGTYVFTVAVTDDKGLVKTDDVSVFVNPVPTVPPPSGKYEGFGSQAVGGTVQATQHVTSESDFFAKLGSNRILVFDNDVTIRRSIYATNLSYLTIDANGHNVVFDSINDDGISFEGSGCHHIILIGVKVTNCTGDGINATDGAHDIVFDHCTVYDSGDGNLDIAAVTGKNFTVQWCFIGRGKAGWSGASLGTSKNMSFHHNLISPEGKGVGERCPLVHAAYSGVGAPNADIRNNLINNWVREGGGGSFGICVNYGATANVVNNYLVSKANPNDGISTNAYGTPGGSIYAAGNVSGNGVNLNTKSNHSEFIITDPYKISVEDAVTSAKRILQGVGSPVKGSYELGVINAIKIS